MNFGNLPDVLRATARFCVWTRAPDGKGGTTKVPINPRTGYGAKANDVRTFTDFNTAVAAVQPKGCDGIGLGIFDDVCAIDIDGCIENGVPSPMAQAIIDIMHSYTEISPSGHGIRILFSVAKGFTYDKATYRIMYRDIGLEIYVAGVTSKYVTVTGNIIPAGEYGDRTVELQIVLDKYMKRNQDTKASAPSHQPASNLSDDEILEKAGASKNGAKFNALYSGDISEYPSHSEADLSLCGMLAFWCGCDPVQIDRLFRGSGLFRGKWDEPRSGTTYGKCVIENAIRGCTNFYKPSQKHSVASAPKKGKPTKPLDMVSAAELVSMKVGELEYLVDGLVHQGLCILSADPKAGKSLLGFDLSLSVASGTQFLGRETHQCDTIYLALEDSLRRLQGRMRKMLAGKGIQPPPNCYLVTAADPLDGELFPQLEEALEAHPNTRLLVVDVFNRIRGNNRTPGKTPYEFDSCVMAQLKGFADKHSLCLLLIHHTKKSKDVSDPHLNFLGSQGIFGGVDASFVLTKENRTDCHATLSVISREMDGVKLTIELDPDTLLWSCVEVEEEINPIVETIKALLETSPEGRWKGTVTQLLNAGETITGEPIAEDPQSLGYALRKLDMPKEITYKAFQSGNSGKLHQFELKIKKEVPASVPPIKASSITGITPPSVGPSAIDEINAEGVVSD